MSQYWEKRSLEIDKSIFADAERYVSYLHKEYQKAIDELDKQILYHLTKIESEQGVSLQEAKKLIDKADRMDLETFINLAKGEVSEEINKRLNLQSRRVRISYLQAMELEMKSAVAKIMTKEEKGLFAHLSNSYENKFYQNLYELQKVTGFKKLTKISHDKLQRIILNPWTPDGSNFSEKIWLRGDKLINALRTDLTQSLAMGKNPKEVAKRIQNTFNVSKANAARLVMTETSAISAISTKQTYKDMGVEKYEICSVLDSRTSNICQGMDGKVFNLKDWEIGVTANPFHPNCRTTTLPYFDDDIQKEIDEAVGRVARDPRTGKNVRISNMQYKEWFEKYVVP